MRRTGLSAMALACAAVLAGAVPAFADGTPTPVPSQSAAPTKAPSDAPRPATSAEPTRAPSDAQVSVRPSGAPNTGEVTPSSGSATGGLIGGGAAAAIALGGGVLLVRRRRANGV
ncbi:sortase-dependent protein [Streptomyces sp. NPDC092369]|uniref:sortase-dependent protein n=1 Tax=Streptomyces sp. NPDC092369 TaxID=3366015 RepID=UPI00382618B1